MDYYKEIEKLKNLTSSEMKTSVLNRLKTNHYKLYQYCSFYEEYDLFKNTKPDCDFNHGYRNLLRKIIYASKPSHFNDPFDCEIGFSSQALLGDILKSFMNLNYVDMAFDKKEIHRLFREVKGQEKRLETVKTWKPSIIRDILIEVFLDDKIYKRLVNENTNKSYKTKPMNVLEKKKVMKEILSKKSFQDSFLENFLDKKYLNDSNYAKLKDLFSNQKTLIDTVFIDPVSINMTQENSIDEIKIDLEKIDIIGQTNKLDAISAQTQEMKEALKTAYDVATDGLKNFSEKVDKHFGVTCFSRESNLPLMWSHYANKHRGFVVEYDFSNLSEEDAQKLVFLMNVKYQMKRPRLDPYDLQRIFDSNETEQVLPLLIKTFVNIMFVKSIIWSKEKETRNICLIKEEDNRFIPLNYVKSIYLGVNSGPKLENLMIELCKLEKYNLYKFEMEKDEYKITKKQINF